MAQYIADHQLSTGFRGLGDDAARIGHGGGQRFFDEDMRPRLHRRHGIIGVAVGISGDADQIGLGLRQRLIIVAVARYPGKRLGQVQRAAVDQTRQFHLGMGLQGQRMAAPHVAQTCDHRPDHLTAPEVMPRISWRENTT